MERLRSRIRRSIVAGSTVNHLMEPLEDRRLFANGITPAAAPELFGIASQPINNALVADFTVSDSSGLPGTKWESQIIWGDGSANSKNVAAVADPTIAGQFDFFGSHTYANPGTYTITAMIAVPGSGIPNANTVTTQASIAGVPEPSSVAVVAVGATLLLTRGRRRETAGSVSRGLVAEHGQSTFQ